MVLVRRGEGAGEETNQIPSSWLSCVTHLVVGGEDEEDFGLGRHLVMGCLQLAWRLLIDVVGGFKSRAIGSSQMRI